MSRHRKFKRHESSAEVHETDASTTRDAIAITITFAIIGAIVISIEFLLHSESNTIYHVASGVLAAPIHLLIRKVIC